MGEKKIKVKVDEYVVHGKKRDFHILKFPDLKHIDVCDLYPAEEYYDVSGSISDMTYFQHALAILLDSPYKIMYFPLRDNEFKCKYDLVVLRPELQFRRSEWYKLKPRLNRQHWIGKYKYTYYIDTVKDQWEKVKKEIHYQSSKNRSKRINVEEILGSTMFLVISKEYIIEILYDLSWTIDAVLNLRLKDFKSDLGYSWYYGYLVPDEEVEEKKEFFW